MQVATRLVGHAALRTDCGSFRLLTDPWLTGPVFEDGWEHVLPPEAPGAEIPAATHVWISHEHPDHFSPRDLRGATARPPLLTIRTRDGRVASACRAWGYSVAELEPWRWHALAPGVRAMTGPYGDDSWLCLDTPASTMLNVNDCSLEREEDLRAVAAAIGKPIDTLATQFSYASHAGDTPEARRASAAEVLARVRAQIRALAPRFVIPFASFARFAHEENAAMNDGAARVRDAVETIRAAGATPVVLFPGKAWTHGDDPADNEPNLARWDEAYVAATRRPLRATPPVPLAKLRELSAARWARVRAAPGLASRLVYGLNPPPVAEITDLGIRVRLDADLAETTRPPHVHLSSSALAGALRQAWGGGTLHISARFRRGVGSEAFFRHLSLDEEANHGRSLRWRIPGDLARALRLRRG